MKLAYIAAFVMSFSACSAGGPSAPLAAGASNARPLSAGLGPVVTSRFGGEIFGWDIDQNGNDGLLTETALEGGAFINAIETFDESTGKITKVVQKVERPNASVEPVVDAIAGSDVGIVDVERALVGLERSDYFDLLSPVSHNKLTGRTKPQHDLGMVPSFFTNNQASSSQVMIVFYTDKHGHDRFGLYTYDTVAKTWGTRLDFPQRFLFQSQPNYAVVDAATNEAVVGHLKRSRYNPHESTTFEVLDAKTGKHLRSFYGVGYGFPNGMAIDPTTGVLCTTTTGDMDVEFYMLATGKGKAVQIPILNGGGGPLTNGAAVAADPIHHLFLIAQLNSTVSPSGGSSVLVYDEHGKLVEYIDGFEFLNNYTVIPPHVAVNPANRTGYVNGPTVSQLQEFTY